MNYVYIVSCSDGTLYTGWTTNLESRLRKHNAGKGARYTRGRTPVELVYFEECQNRSEAMKREYAIKQLSHSDKQNLVNDAKVMMIERC